MLESASLGGGGLPGPGGEGVCLVPGGCLPGPEGSTWSGGSAWSGGVCLVRGVLPCLGGPPGLGGGLPGPGGVPGPGGGGAGIPACTEADTPPVDRHTPVKNITLATTSLRPVKRNKNVLTVGVGQ